MTSTAEEQEDRADEWLSQRLDSGLFSLQVGNLYSPNFFQGGWITELNPFEEATLLTYQ